MRNQVWLADITYIGTGQGWLYLAAIMDLHTRRIVGRAMDDHLRAELPLAALRVAIKGQNPGAGLIHHSDRGIPICFDRVPPSAASRRLPALDEPQSRLL